MKSVADWQPERRVLASVTLGARRPLISPWVFTHTGFAAFVLFIADLMTGRV